MTRPTPAEVRAEPPGPRLDAWYHEVVLGWEQDEDNEGNHVWVHPTEKGFHTGFPPVSTDPALLGPELVRLDGLGIEISVQWGVTDSTAAFVAVATVRGRGRFVAYAKTRSEAVPKAALLARLGGES